MERYEKAVISVVVVSLISLASFSIAWAQEATFTFDPPDSITFLQMQTVVKNTVMGQMDTIDEVMELVTRMTIVKTESGYRVIATPLSVTATRNGEPVDDPILDLAQNIVVNYHLDKDGKLAKVTGYEKLKEMMRELIPEDVGETLSAVLDEDALKKRDADEWNHRIGDFIGRKAIPGQSWAAVDTIPVPSGEHVTSYSLVRCQQRTEFDNHQCLKLVFDYNSDESALNAGRDDSLGRVQGRAADSFSSGSSGPAIVGSGQRLIDPSTMLIYYEVVERTLTGKIRGSDQVEVGLVETERREYKYDYSY